MDNYRYLDESGRFLLKNPEKTSYLYFPMANEKGAMSSITPNLSGDMKLDQNTFLMAPVSSENLHNDKSSRNIWFRINGQHLWSATGKSAQQQSELFSADKEETELEAEFMCQTLRRRSPRMGLAVEIVTFVPYNEIPMEYISVSYTNISDTEITVEPTVAIPIYARSATDYRDHRHVTSLLNQIRTTKNGVIVEPTLTFDERGHQKNEVSYGVFASSEDESPQCFYPVVEDFIGEGGSLEHPLALHNEHSSSDANNTGKGIGAGYQVAGYEAMGGIGLKKKTIKPGEKASFIIVSAIGSKQEDLQLVVADYLNLKRFQAELLKTKTYWQDRVNIHYHTGNAGFDGYMRWVSFQPILRRIYGCSFLPHHDYGKGGRGWRDLWQDCLALLIMEPQTVKAMLLANFAGVRIDGTNATIIGENEFIADRNNITRVWMDHGVWPLLTTDLYIQQTGDLQILLETQTYFKDMQVCRGESKDLEWSDQTGNIQRTTDGSEYHGTLLEHLLLQNLTAFYDVGEHNHMRIRGADWNDALDLAKERGESVAFTAMYAYNLEKLAEYLESFYESGIETVDLLEEIQLLLKPAALSWTVTEKQKALAEFTTLCSHHVSGTTTKVSVIELLLDLRAKATWIKENIRTNERIVNYEEEIWYNGYYDNSGAKLEGLVAGQARMMLTSQVFTIMSGTATDQELDKIIDSVDRHLFNPDVGGYRLNTDFNELKMDMGRMFGFAYGHKENGAVFSHMAVMYANALYSRGQAQAGYKALEALYQHSSNFEKSKIYPGIPEYFDAKGRGMYHYLTGAASWYMVTVITQMFGVRGRLGNLEFKPQLLQSQFDQDGYASISLQFADKKFHVQYVNKNNKEAGSYQVVELLLNGTPYPFTNQQCEIKREDIHTLSSEHIHTIQVVLI